MCQKQVWVHSASYAAFGPVKSLSMASWPPTPPRPLLVNHGCYTGLIQRVFNCLLLPAFKAQHGLGALWLTHKHCIWRIACRPGHGSYMGGRPSSDSLQVQPGPSWRALLLGPSHYSWLHNLLSHLQQQPESAIAQLARQFVVRCMHPSAYAGSKPHTDRPHHRLLNGVQLLNQGLHLWAASLLGSSIMTA